MTTKHKSRIPFMDFANNSLTRSVFMRFLPSGRKISDDPLGGSCPILDTNNTLTKIVPGWEGIPANAVINIILSLVFLFVFYLLIRKVYKTERKMGVEYVANERSHDWVHFIYGKRGLNQTLLDSTKEINRNEPTAYLPVVLHKHTHLIKGMPKEKSPPKNLIKSKTNEDTDQDIEPESTLRTDSDTLGMEEEEDKMLAYLKSILFDEDFDKSYEFTKKVNAQLNVTQAEDREKWDLYNEDVVPLGTSKTFCQWFKKYLCIKDKEIYQRRGYDALHYLVFQRYLIYYLFAVTIICLFIILPLNLYAGKLNDFPNTYYKRTTILNVKNASPLIYVHALMTIFVVFMGIYLMRDFSCLIGKKAKKFDLRILLIENIPKDRRDPIELKDFLAKSFPNVIIKGITFIYDVNKLTDLMMTLLTSIEAKNFCLNYKRRYGERCQVRPYWLGNLRGIVGCARCYPKVDGITFYTNEKERLLNEIDKEFVLCTKKPDRIAFVVFKNKAMAAKVYNHFKQRHCHCYTISIFFRRLFGRHRSDAFDSWKWQLQYAPYPEDIDWKGITASKCKIWSLNVLMNLIIIIIFLFLTTPSSALKIISYFISSEESGDASEEINRDPLYVIFWSYAPTIATMIIADQIPGMISRLTSKTPFRTKSDFNHSIMVKSYLFLILNVLILPSLEIITISQLFGSKDPKTGEPKEFTWSCLFPAENGVFFLNLVMTSALVGNIRDVLRISELRSYLISLVIDSRTYAEYLTARQNTAFVFSFGGQYPGILLHFTLIITFSMSDPLIAPIGLFYFLMKHHTDRYFLYHISVPTKISERVHSKAVVYVYFALLYLLIQIYTHLSAMDFTLPSYIVGLGLLIHIILCVIEFFRDSIFNISRIGFQ